jgi:hypothetical protein
LPALWQELPQTFCGQLTTFCGDLQEDAAAARTATGLAGEEKFCAAALGNIMLRH